MSSAANLEYHTARSIGPLSRIYLIPQAH